MTLEKIRQKTEELHARTRQALLRGMVTPLIVLAISGWGIAWFDSPIARAAFAFAISYSLAGQYFVNRSMWSGSLPDADVMSTGLKSYRHEIERRRDLSRHFLLWSLGPVLFAIASFVAPLAVLAIRRGLLLNMVPFLAVLVIWLVSVIVIRITDQRQLQREINELNDIERGNGQIT